jgi:Cip1-like, core domain
MSITHCGSGEIVGSIGGRHFDGGAGKPNTFDGSSGGSRAIEDGGHGVDGRDGPSGIEDSAGGAGAAGAGGSGDTGENEAGPMDAGGEGDGAISPGCIGRSICDDFENAIVGQAPGAPWRLGALEKGHVVVDDTRAYSGQRSVRFMVDAMASSADISRHATIEVSGAPLFPLANDKVYGRFMMYTDRIPPYPNHWTTAQGSGPVPSAADTNGQYNYGGQGDLMANYYRPAGATKIDCWQTKNVGFPVGRWTCVAFLFDGGANEMRYWQDGVEVPELHVLGLDKRAVDCTDKTVDGRWLAPRFDKISLGWQSYGYDNTGKAHDVWIDDVVLDDEPIACPP